MNGVICWIYGSYDDGYELFQLPDGADPAEYGRVVTLTDEEYADYRQMRQSVHDWQVRIWKELT